MSWLLQAHGAVDREITDPKVWAKIEDELAEALHKVLSRPEFGTQHSVLGLRLVQGAVHKEGEPLAKGAPDDGTDSNGNPLPQSAFAGPDELAAQQAAQAEAAQQGQQELQDAQSEEHQQ